MGNLSMFNLDFSQPYKPVKSEKAKNRFYHRDDAKIVEFLELIGNVSPFIAGGACLAWYENRPVTSDIDCYFPSKNDYDSFVEKLTNSKGYVNFNINTTMTSDNATSFGIAHKDGKIWSVQLIKKNFYPTLEAVLDDFDITVCKVGYHLGQVVMRSTFVKDVKHRRLVFDSINPGSHKRLVKYMSYGFEPSLETIKELCANNIVNWQLKGTDHYA